MRISTGAVLFVVLLMAGCSANGSGTQQAQPTQTDVLTQSSPTQAGVTLGTQVLYPEGSGGVTALQYRRGIKTENDKPGTRWDAMKVKTCAPAEEDITVSWTPWGLVDADGGRYAAKGDTYTIPKPEYPFDDGVVTQGECVVGWVVVGIPLATKAVGIRYQSADGFTARWKVPS
jgi:hypothetical protein